MSSSGNVLDAALAYAGAGWFVFPMRANKKIPCIAWGEGSTRNPERIRALWSEFPDADIAVDCGKSGLIVLDVDVKDGQNGLKSLAALVGKSHDLLSPVRATTPSGGRHYFYRARCGCAIPKTGESKVSEDTHCDECLDNSVSVIGEHLDIRARNGCILVAPSVVQGKAYEFKDGLESILGDTPVFPDEFYWELFERSHVKTEIFADADGKVPDGMHQEYLFKQACSERGKGLEQPALLAHILKLNQEKCNPPSRNIAKIKAMVARVCLNFSAGSNKTSSQKASRPATGFAFKTAPQVLESASQSREWLIENLLGPNGLCLFSAAQGTGKSTLMRTLASAVADGQKFLGRQCKKGLVAWMGLEEAERDLASAIEDLDLLDNENIIYISPEDVDENETERWAQLETFIVTMKPKLIIIDTIAKFAKLGDINHYEEVGKGFRPFLTLRSKYPVAFMLLHHVSKSGTPIGSQRLQSDVDVVLNMVRNEDNARIISTSKVRAGAIDIEQTTLRIDMATKRILSEEPKWKTDKRICAQNILNYLNTVEQATKQELADHAGRSGDMARSAVADLVQEGLVIASGSGRRNDPRLYSLKGSPMSMPGVGLTGSFPRIPILNNTSPDTGVSPRNNTSTHAVFSTINSNIYIKENGCESEESEETGNARELSGYDQSEVSPRRSEVSPKIVRGKSEESEESEQSEESDGKVTSLLGYAAAKLGEAKPRYPVTTFGFDLLPEIVGAEGLDKYGLLHNDAVGF